MQLYFIRHGKADCGTWDGGDFDRPLTTDGRAGMEEEAARLRDIGLELDCIVSSPLARAVQTAEIIASKLEIDDRLVLDDRLGPGFDVKALQSLLREHTDAERIALVGHEPGFSSVIGGVIGGGSVVCKKGSVARVDVTSRENLDGELVWLLQPRTLVG
jgi:phosphohistidine phosphatase